MRYNVTVGLINLETLKRRVIVYIELYGSMNFGWEVNLHVAIRFVLHPKSTVWKSNYMDRTTLVDN